MFGRCGFRLRSPRRSLSRTRAQVLALWRKCLFSYRRLSAGLIINAQSKVQADTNAAEATAIKPKTIISLDNERKEWRRYSQPASEAKRFCGFGAGSR